MTDGQRELIRYRLEDGLLTDVRGNPPMVSRPEKGQGEGYEPRSPQEGEFDVWENEQVWPDG